MNIDDVDFADFVNKRVLLVLKPVGEDAGEQLEGVVQAGAAQGLMFKAKGKGQPDLIERTSVVSITEQAEKPKPVKAKTLKLVDEDAVKAHVADRHGVTLDWVNSNAADAVAGWHNELDHAEHKLGHVHKVDKAEAAIEQAADTDDSSE